MAATKRTGGAKRPAAGAKDRRSVDAYLAKVPPEERRVLGRLRAQVKAVAPRATETISYGIPTFKLDGKALIYFGAWKTYCSVYGVPTDLPELKNFDVQKGTIRFQTGKPLPASLVTKLVKARMTAIKQGASY